MEQESNLMNAYLTAYKLSCEKIKKMNIEDICQNTGAFYDENLNILNIKYINNEYIVNVDTGDVVLKDDDKEVTTTVKVLILHYLINAQAKALTGNLISFKEIPGGRIYYETFNKRAIVPLIKSFATDFLKLKKAAEILDGIKENYGHLSYTINIFPLVPVTYVLWKGDEEFPASGTILFDQAVTSFLPDEDIVLAASFGVYELIALSMTV